MNSVSHWDKAQAKDSGSQSKEWFVTRSPICGLLVQPQKSLFWNINVATLYEKCQK